MSYGLVRWTLDRPGRRATADPAHTLHGRGGAARRPGRCAGRQDRALLVADEGWQRGTVARLCPRGAFSHRDVVAYNRH